MASDNVGWGLIIMSVDRSRKYGQLRGGELVRVPWVLVKRMKQHFHELQVCALIALTGVGLWCVFV